MRGSIARRALLPLVPALALAACDANRNDTDQGDTPMTTKTATIRITSTAFTDGARIPTKYTGDGKNVSPPLSWTDAPEETKAFALICDDPDAPRPQPWVHWLIWNIPPEQSSLPEGVPQKGELSNPKGVRQGCTSWGEDSIGYRGPEPPPGHGTHHYHFRLYALDGMLDLEPGASKNALLHAMQGHIIAEGEIIGTYER